MYQRTAYSVWDRNVRIFHWINAVCVLSLGAIGLLILNGSTLGVDGQGKVLLKTIHTYIGYFFAGNLIWRLTWCFFGSEFARWPSIVPFGKGYSKSLRAHVASLFSRNSKSYLGHTPLARLAISLMIVLLVLQAATGLVLAGTDLYKPPFGHFMAEWVTLGDPSRMALLSPGDRTYVDQTAYEAMREFRKPFVIIHLYCFYSIGLMVLLHIVGVIVAELREKNAIVSAMITGEKNLVAPPVDSANAIAQELGAKKE